MIEDIEQKLHMCHMQTEWIEEKIQKFGEKMDMAETEKQKKELEQEGLQLLDQHQSYFCILLVATQSSIPKKNICLPNPTLLF